MTEVSRSKLLKGAGWVSAATVAVNALGIVSTIILARLLLPEDFGLVAIATALVGIIGVLTEFSLSKALIQHREPTDDHYHTAWTMNIIRAAIVGGVIAALGVPLSYFYEDARLAPIVWVLGFVCFIGGFNNPKMAVFQRELSFRQSFIMRCTSKLAGFIVCVPIAWIYQSYWALIFGVLATETAVLIVSYVLIPFRPRLTISEYRELLSFSIWLTLAKWVQAVNWRAQPLVYGYVLPSSLIGQLSLSGKLMGNTIEQATSPVRAMLFPAFSRLQDEKNRLRLGYIRSQGTICLITFPIAAGLAVMAEDIVLLAIGDKWLPAVPLMQLMAITRIIKAGQNLGPVAMATAHTKNLFHRDLRAFLIRWPLVLSGMYLGRGDPYTILIGGMLGEMGAACANGYLNMRLIGSITPITVADHVSFVWRPLIAILTMVAVLHGLSGLAPAPTLTPIAAVLKILTLAGLGALVYPLVLYALWVIGGKGDTVEKECAGILKDIAAKTLIKIRPAAREG
ncbi:MAG: lipopolysaccharide biosynthesis protein [Pseudomonadota bacterium]